MTRRLSLEETKQCLRAWRELGDKDAYELLVVSNARLVAFIVKKYLGKGVAFEDLMSAGNE